MPDIIYLTPLIFIVVVAIFFGFWRLNTRGTRAAIVSVIRVLVFGTLALIVLIFVVGGLWIGLYFLLGGH